MPSKVVVQNGTGRFSAAFLAPGATRSRYHITAAGQTVAVINETATGAPETHYLHRDHLDSVVALSNERGQVLERFHYDPFGQRRMAVGYRSNHTVVAFCS